LERGGSSAVGRGRTRFLTYALKQDVCATFF
jgi:hypothetical protein